MPKKEQTISIHNLDTDTALAIAYETFVNVGWPPKFAGPNKLMAFTDGGWKTAGQQIIVGVADHQLNISSDTQNNQSFDIGGKNKKNLAAFITAFQSLESNISTEKIEDNKQAINHLREETEHLAEEERRHSEEVDAVMNLSTSNLYITYGIIAINVLVFIAMAVSGVSLFSPTAIDIIKWGGNYGPLTVSGDWWRLITNTFEHIGIIHIAFNMYALYMVGIYLEPMLGKVRYTVAYLCTGVIASLASLWWHLSTPTSSAGASGAIFGIYGVFLALLSTSLIPKKVRTALLQSIGVFVVFNLFYGIKSGIDNAAHIGGLLSGVLIGYAYYFTLKKEFSTRSIAVVSALVIGITAGGTYLFLQNVKGAGSEEVKQLRNEIEDAGYPDAEKYDIGIKRFSALEDEALKPFNDTVQSDEQLGDRLYVVSEPKWKEAATIISQMKDYRVSETAKKRVQLIGDYIEQRQQEISIIRQIAKGDQQAVEQLNTIRNKLSTILNKLKEL